jgi:chromosome segregation ATPase
MDIDQAAKTIAWPDDERRKDRQEITALQERVAAVTAENQALVRRVQEVEAGLAQARNEIQRSSKIDALLEANRKDMARQFEELERRRLEAAREDERLRKIERDVINKSLADLRKSLDVLPRLDREITSRRDEESRVARAIAELQLKVAEFNKHVDDRNRAVTLLEEGRRADMKRIADLQTEASELRKRLDTVTGKVEIVEDTARRTDARLAEVFALDADRKAAQAQWIETQAKVLTEHERAFADLKATTEAALRSIEDSARRVDQYSDAFRDMRRIVDEGRQLVELIERRVAESSELHRLAEEKLRQDWATFLADEQKRWTTHMLMRDEQWRENDRQAGKLAERVASFEEQMADLAATLRQVQTTDATRMQTLLNVVRELAADYDPSFAKTR